MARYFTKEELQQALKQNIDTPTTAENEQAPFNQGEIIAPASISRGTILLSGDTAGNSVYLAVLKRTDSKYTKANWENYIPGNCVLCRKLCFDLLWKGKRSERNKQAFQHHLKMWNLVDSSK